MKDSLEFSITALGEIRFSRQREQIDENILLILEEFIDDKEERERLMTFLKDGQLLGPSLLNKETFCG